MALWLTTRTLNLRELSSGVREDSRVLHAYIDESGDRGSSPTSSHHFVMTAFIYSDADGTRATNLLADLRSDLGRKPNVELGWKYLRSHEERLHAAVSLGSQHDWGQVTSVIVCKRRLDGTVNNDERYLHTFQLLLERLSWIARDRQDTVAYTLAHIVRFKIERLREFEANLKTNPTSRIHWDALDPHGGRMVAASTEEKLQLADLAASATAAAFNPDRFGHTETRYLEQLAPLLYRGRNSPLTSYGLKLFPSDESTRAAYPWVAAL
ncbi:DUF3800 domain-containing protein [Curtobacterium sp. GD1]|nr:DUF3800 domain-containing protein [Curtobacterium sp. GD1]